MAEQTDSGWLLAGDDAGRFGLVNEYLSYLADRNYSPRTIRTYGFMLLAFCRWLAAEDIDLADVTTDVLLRFLAACRTEQVAGRRGGANVVGMDGRRTDTVSPATVNLRVGRGVGVVLVPVDAGSGCAEPGPEGPGGQTIVGR